MIHVDLADAISGLDDELLDDYLTRRAENLKRMRRRRAWVRGLLTAAACLLVVLSVTAKISFDRLYPYIPLENGVGDISVRYVPEWMAKDTSSGHLPDITDSELFNQADCIFAGTVNKIDYIKTFVGNRTFFHSIVTIQVDCLFRGDDKDEIRLITPPIFNDNEHSDKILHLLREGCYGIFIVNETDNNRISFNSSYIELSDLADTEILEEYCFAFLYEETKNQFDCYDTIHNHKEKLFASLNTYDPSSVYEYIQKMIKEKWE